MFLRLSAVCAVFFLTACIIVPVPLPAPTAQGGAGGAAQILPATAPVSEGFDRLLRDARMAAGAAPLRSHSPLDRVAAAHAADMVARGYLAHRSPEGLRADGRVRAAGIATCGTSEVLAQGRRSFAATFADWMASPGHRAAILDPTMASYGIGQRGTTWVMVLVRACPVQATR